MRASVAKEAVRGELVVMLKRFEPEPIPVSLVYVRERRLAAKLRAFIDYAARMLRERLVRKQPLGSPVPIGSRTT